MDRPAATSSERLRLVGLLFGHVRLAARLAVRARLSRRPPPYRGGRPLEVAILSPASPGSIGTIGRFSRWVPHLTERGCRVRILCPVTDREFAAHWAGEPGADLRFHRAALRNHGRNLVAAARADVVVLHRGVFPFGPWQRPTFERLLARLNPRVVYDFFDAIWIPRREAHEASRSRIARWLNRPDQIEAILGTPSAVTVTGEFLAAFAREHHGDVRILPMLLEAEEYAPRTHRPVAEPVVGWMGGAGNIEKLVSIGAGLRRAAERAPFLLRVVSSRTVSVDGVSTESLTHPWSPESERADLAGLDIGLVPLLDRPYDRGKFPLKLLQYAAAGLPIVASPLVMDHFRDGESLLIAATDEEWADAVARLVGDPALRARLGAAARRVLERHYTFAAHADSYDALLREVAERP